MNTAERNGDSPIASIKRTYADATSEVPATPSSIQSMLRNTTETGEIGLFSIRPVRLSRAVPQVSPRTSSLPYIPDAMPQHLPNQLAGRDLRRCAGDVRLNSLQSYRGTTPSSIISLYHSESQRSFRTRTSLYAGNEQRMFPNSQSSHGLSNHRSYTGLRSRSPFAYPTRLKRPGYRPSSPALTDFNGTISRTLIGLDQGVSFRTPSPLSTSAPQIQPTGYYLAMNRSLPSLHHPPAPFSASQGRALRTPSVSSRTATMRQPPYQMSGSQPHGLYRGTSQGSAWSNSQPPSPSPLYYDYSEVFEDQHRLNHTNTSALSLLEKVGLENRRLGEVPDRGATDVRLENAALEDANDPACEPPNRFQPYVESPSPVNAPNKFLKQMSEWEKEQDNPQCSGNDSSESQETRTTIGNSDREIKAMQKQNFKDSTVVDTFGHHILSSSRTQNRYCFTQSPHYTIDERFTLHKSTNQVTRSKGGLDARKHLDAVTRVSKSLHPAAPHIQGHLPTREWTIPFLNLSPFEIGTKERSILEGQLKNPILLQKADYPTIQVPVPNRSASFRGDRDRFSRILSIDEGFAQLDRAILDSGLQSVTTPHASVVSNSRSDSAPHQDLSGPPASNFSSATSSNATKLAEKHDGSSSTKDYQNKPEDKSMRSEASSLWESATILAVEGFLHAKTAAHPEHSGIEPLLAKLEPALKPETSTNVNCERSGSPSDAGISQTHREYSMLPEQFVHSSTPCEHYSAVRHGKLPYSAPALAQSQDKAENNACLEAASIVPWEYDETKDETFPITKYKLRAQSEGASRGPPFDPRPSDSDAQFQWAGLVGKGAPSHHAPLSKSKSTNAKAPKFKLNITRASSSTNGTVRVTLSPTSSPRHSFGATFDLFQGGPSRRRSKTESTVDGNPLQVNPTAQTLPEVGGNGIPIQTPQISIMPRSPTLHLAEVQSFFSDDSSNVEIKGSLRQRLSHLKVIASRGNSTDELQNSDRKQIGAANGSPRGVRVDNTRHNRHSSVQSRRTSGSMSNAKCKRRKIGGKLKSWWHRGEDKLKGIANKMKKGRKKRLVSSLYAGV